MSVDISVSITEDIVDIIATPTVNIVNVTNSASIDPSLYDLSEFTNTSVNPFVRTSGLSSYVPTSRTLTINGTTQDLSADRTFTISTGITIGTTAITSGTVGRVLFEGTGNVVQESDNLFWDNTNGRLGIGTSSPASKVDILQVADNTSPTLLRLNNTGTGSATGATLEFPFGAFIRSSFASMILSDRSGATVTLQGATLGTSASNFNLSGAGVITFTGGSGTDGMIRTGGTITFNTFSGGYRDVGKFFQTGNFLIQNGGTFTDAGFRLDVNGTLRASFGQLWVGGGHYLEGVAASGTDASVVLRRTANNGWVRFGLGVNSPVQLAANTNTGEAQLFAGSGGYFPTFYSNGAERMRIPSTGNVLINTTTDAGFRLDVNGTARVDQTLRLNGTGTGTAIQFPGGRIDADTNWIRIKSSTNQDLINVANNFVGINATTVIASAIFAITSTNRGFLPPRMTTTEINAIASPAEGLMVYNTTISHTCVYQAGSWVKINHSPM